jgi:hypothetical protein
VTIGINGLVLRGLTLSFRRMPSLLGQELARLRAMTATEKVATMHALWRQAWSLAEAGVRGRHPDWSEDQVAAEVRELLRRSAA